MAAAKQYNDTGKELLTQAAASVNDLVKKDPATDKYVAQATLQSLVDDLTSGFLSSSDGKTAIATMFAEDADVRASITTLVNDEMGSAINIDADDINLKGHVWGDQINAVEFRSEDQENNYVGSTEINGEYVRVRGEVNGVLTERTDIMPGRILMQDSSTYSTGANMDDNL